VCLFGYHLEEGDVMYEEIPVSSAVYTKSFAASSVYISDNPVPGAAAGFCRHCRSNAADAGYCQLSLTCFSAWLVSANCVP